MLVLFGLTRFEQDDWISGTDKMEDRNERERDGEIRLARCLMSAKENFKTDYRLD